MREGSFDPMLPRIYTVQRLKEETRDTCTFELQSRDGAPVPCYEPGQFNMLYVFGKGEAPISISGDPARRKNLVHTVRAVGMVTKALCGMHRGDEIGVRGPFGAPWPMQEAVQKDVVIAAGGLGLAPLRPVVYQLLSNREKYGKIALLYGARTPRDLLFKAEMEKWSLRPDLQVKITVDSAGNGWMGNIGVVTALVSKVRFDPLNTVAMVCGPEVMMRFTIMELLKSGLPKESIYISMERNMKCAAGFCGRCQFGSLFVCRDGPVFSYGRVSDFFGKHEI